MLAASSLAVASLGLGTYLAALEVAGSSLSRPQQALGEWRPQAYAVREELERPACRRNNFADPHRPIVRIGQGCP
jgi:hypothetical protein